MQEVPVMSSAAAALAAGSWQEARSGFETALREGESPEARFGLGTALIWLGETEAAVAMLERAYAGFRHRSDAASAALAAMQLGVIYGSSLGNLAVAQGWLGRLARLVEDHELTPLHGWLALCRAAHASETGHPTEAAGHATEALREARSRGDPDLELCALSELGVSRVLTGQVSDGAALLDEAMAGALGGEGRQLQTVVYAGCRSIVACTRVLELERAVQWIRAADRFTRRYGNPHLYTTCRTEYAGVLFTQGRWEEAEKELRSALQIGRSAEPLRYGDALAKLAELRVAQGRLEEAEGLLTDIADHPAAVYPRAELCLRRGDARVAATLALRRLAEVEAENPAVAPLRELAVEAEIAAGNVQGAHDGARQLSKLGEATGRRPVIARAARALGRVGLASGDLEAATGHLERALAAFTRLGIPMDTARTHLLLARAAREGEPATAVAEAQAALAIFDRLGATAGADEAANFLRGLGMHVMRRQTRGGEAALSRREHEVLALLGEGLTNQQIAERLFLARKTVERHVRDLFIKLGVSNRSQAAAYAVRHASRLGQPGPEPTATD